MRFCLHCDNVLMNRHRSSPAQTHLPHLSQMKSASILNAKAFKWIAHINFMHNRTVFVRFLGPSFPILIRMNILPISLWTEIILYSVKWCARDNVIVHKRFTLFLYDTRHANSCHAYLYTNSCTPIHATKIIISFYAFMQLN